MEEFEEFEKLVKPIIEYIKKKYAPHTTIIITENYAKVVQDELVVPIELD